MIDPILIPLHVPFRTLSTLQNATIPLASQPSVVSKERAREFMSYFPDVVREVMERVKKASNPEIANHVVRVSNKLINDRLGFVGNVSRLIPGSSIQLSRGQEVPWHDRSPGVRDAGPKGPVDGGEFEAGFASRLDGRIRKFYLWIGVK